MTNFAVELFNSEEEAALRGTPIKVKIIEDDMNNPALILLNTACGALLAQMEKTAPGHMQMLTTLRMAVLAALQLEGMQATQLQAQPVAFSKYSSLDYIKTPEDLEAYVQERIRADKEESDYDELVADAEKWRAHRAGQ